MYCRNCGREIPEGSTFCGYCGMQLSTVEVKNAGISKASSEDKDKETEQIVSADNDKHAKKKQKKQTQKQTDKSAKKSEKNASRNIMTTGQKIGRFFRRLLFTVILLAVLAAVVVFALSYFEVCEIPYVSELMREYGIVRDGDNELSDLLGEIEDINIGESTRSRCEVLETISVSDAMQTASESEIVSLYEERGFNGANVSSMYSMDGEYLNEQTIDGASETQHPLYCCLYISPDNYYWQVYYCNGEFSAYPLSYVLSGLASYEVLVSENEYVISYDSETDCFYRIIPNDGEGLIIETERIDADTLNELAVGELSIS